MPGRVLTPTDCYAIVNAVAKEMTGQEPTLQAVNTSTFVSVGETLLAAGTENVLNALSLVLNRTIIDVRPYSAKLKIINEDNAEYANRIRAISYYSRYAEPSGMFNTNLYTNLAMGYDNGSNGGASVASMWEQNTPLALELNFGGSSVWDYHTTIYEQQLKEAFKDEASFSSFVSGYLTEAANDIEVEKEAFNRLCMLNYFAGIYDLNSVNGAALDMTAGFNAYLGNPSPAVTRSDILTNPTLFETFLKYFTATVKTISDTLENRSLKYHWSPTKTVNGVTYEILRHTPKADQKFLMLKSFWRHAEAQVMPTIFNDKYLKAENFEGVEFWQNELVPESINVTPAIPDTNNPAQQTAGNAVSLDYVIGCIYDKAAMGTTFMLDAVYSTPLEARKAYRNVFTHIKRNIRNNFTHNGVLLYLG